MSAISSRNSGKVGQIRPSRITGQVCSQSAPVPQSLSPLSPYMVSPWLMVGIVLRARCLPRSVGVVHRAWG
jgi:hypothetical protein